ncbi:uncharacterized protein [Ptychodera flava]|uniref:uncharacterized protein n=1 Tax=Ptychodera flava TaxID=63121 RepID=UPI003969E502
MCYCCFCILFIFVFRSSKLTWHGTIPTSEIWIKLGGDKGQGTMRMVYQVANISNPNVADNTVIWSTFAATDSYYNLEIALAVNRGQVDKLDGTKWKDKTLLARMMRDYEYLAKSYGLSGPNGTYFLRMLCDQQGTSTVAEGGTPIVINEEENP